MRTRFLDVDFDRLTREEVLDRLARVDATEPFSYLVTPNVDHLVKLHRDEAHGLRGIVAGARYCLCDSRILARLARMKKVELHVVTGSDLTAGLFAKVLRPGDRVAIVGGDSAMVQALAARFPSVELIHHAPPMGLLQNASAMQATADFVAAARARFSFLAIGFPQQELIAAMVARDPDARGMALCVGASLDFLTDRQRRAPQVMQRLGLEWAYRLSREPRRLWRRYLVDGPTIFRMAWNWQKP